MKVGSIGTQNALGFTIAKNARSRIASTLECCGDPEVHPQVEEYWGNINPVEPRSVYDEVKRFAEALTMVFHRNQRVLTRIMRISNAYGARLRLEDGRAIPAFVSQALRGEPVTVIGDGSQTRSICDPSPISSTASTD